jgi:hypothetical protein
MDVLHFTHPELQHLGEWERERGETEERDANGRYYYPSISVYEFLGDKRRIPTEEEIMPKKKQTCHPFISDSKLMKDLEFVRKSIDAWKDSPKGTRKEKFFGNRFFEDLSRKKTGIKYAVELFDNNFLRLNEVEELFEIYLRWEYDILAYLNRWFKDECKAGYWLPEFAQRAVKHGVDALVHHKRQQMTTYVDWILNSELRAALRYIKWEVSDVSFRLVIGSLSNQVFKLYGFHSLDDTSGHALFKAYEYEKSLQRITAKLGDALSTMHSIWYNCKGRIGTNMVNFKTLEYFYKTPKKMKEDAWNSLLFTSIGSIVAPF